MAAALAFTLAASRVHAQSNSGSAPADEVAKCIVAIRATADPINRYPDRFLFGTDEVAPTSQSGVNAKDLATMATTLAAMGSNPVTGKQVLDPARVPAVLAVMATAGLDDDSGKCLYHTGLPAKSGVGGGIIAVSPGQFGIAVVSPPLDDAGNRVRAQRAIADISIALNGNPCSARPGR